MKENPPPPVASGPCLRVRTPFHTLVQKKPQGYRPTCGRCDATLVSRCDLVGWHEGKPLCGSCLMVEAPALGWVFQLVESSTQAVGRRWPRKEKGRELEALLQLLEGARAALGPLHRGNPKTALALELLDIVCQPEGIDASFLLLELLDVVRRSGAVAVLSELLDVLRRYPEVKP